MALQLRLHAKSPSCSGPDPREFWLGRRRAACPGPVIYCPGAKGPRRGPRSIVHRVLQVTGLELAARTGCRPVGGHPLLQVLPSSFLAAAGNEIPVAGLAPARAGLSVTLSPVDIRVTWAGNAARGGGSWERDTGRRLCSCSDLFRPDLKSGREDSDPEPGRPEPGTRRPASHPTRRSHPARY